MGIAIKRFGLNQVGKWRWVMSQRQANLLWLKDMLDHLSSCQQQLEWTTDSQAVHVLTEVMLRDLDRCQRLCANIHRKAATSQAQAV